SNGCPLRKATKASLSETLFILTDTGLAFANTLSLNKKSTSVLLLISTCTSLIGVYVTSNEKRCATTEAWTFTHKNIVKKNVSFIIVPNFHKDCLFGQYK